QLIRRIKQRPCSRDQRDNRQRCDKPEDVDRDHRNERKVEVGQLVTQSLVDHHVPLTFAPALNTCRAAGVRRAAPGFSNPSAMITLTIIYAPAPASIAHW